MPPAGPEYFRMYKPVSFCNVFSFATVDPDITDWTNRATKLAFADSILISGNTTVEFDQQSFLSAHSFSSFPSYAPVTWQVISIPHPTASTPANSLRIEWQFPKHAPLPT